MWNVFRNKKIEIVNGIKLDSLVDGYIASSICNIDRTFYGIFRMFLLGVF